MYIITKSSNVFLLWVGSLCATVGLLPLSTANELNCGSAQNGEKLTWHRNKNDDKYVCCVERLCPEGTEPLACSADDYTSTQCVPCLGNFYQLRSYPSTRRSYCNPKTRCMNNERVVSDGSAKEDRICECDLSRGFYSNPEDPGSCLRKVCPTGQILIQSGECLPCLVNGDDALSVNCLHSSTSLSPHSVFEHEQHERSTLSAIDTTSVSPSSDSHNITPYSLMTIVVVVVVVVFVIVIIPLVICLCVLWKRRKQVDSRMNGTLIGQDLKLCCNSDQNFSAENPSNGGLLEPQCEFILDLRSGIPVDNHCSEIHEIRVGIVQFPSGISRDLDLQSDPERNSCLSTFPPVDN